MTIDKTVFMELMGELETYYKKEFTSFALGVWYKHLNNRLTTEQFQCAVESAMISKTFIPTPEELIEEALGNTEVLATEDWDLCLRAAARGDKSMLDAMSAQGHAALRLVGGLNELGRSTEDRHTWIKKEFIAIWKSTKADVLSLPASRDTGLERLDAVKNLSKIMNLNGKGT